MSYELCWGLWMWALWLKSSQRLTKAEKRVRDSGRGCISKTVPDVCAKVCANCANCAFQSPLHPALYPRAPPAQFNQKWGKKHPFCLPEDLGQRSRFRDRGQGCISNGLFPQDPRCIVTWPQLKPKWEFLRGWRNKEDSRTKHLCGRPLSGGFARPEFKWKWVAKRFLEDCVSSY